MMTSVLSFLESRGEFAQTLLVWVAVAFGVFGLIFAVYASSLKTMKTEEERKREREKIEEERKRQQEDLERQRENVVREAADAYRIALLEAPAAEVDATVDSFLSALALCQSPEILVLAPEQAYRDCLALLARRPELLPLALRLGREAYGRRRLDRVLTIYDEQAIQNDLYANRDAGRDAGQTLPARPLLLQPQPAEAALAESEQEVAEEVVQPSVFSQPERWAWLGGTLIATSLILTVVAMMPRSHMNDREVREAEEFIRVMKPLTAKLDAEQQERDRQAEAHRRLVVQEQAQVIQNQIQEQKDAAARSEQERIEAAEELKRQEGLEAARKAQAEREAQQRAAIAAAMPTWHAHYVKVMGPMRAALRGVLGARQGHGDLAKACESFSFALSGLARSAEPSPDRAVEESFQALMYRLYDMQKSCSPRTFFQNGQDIEQVTPAFEHLERALYPYHLTP